MSEQHKPDPEFVQYFEDKIGNPFIDSITMMRMEKVYIDQRTKYTKILDRQARAAKMGMDAAKRAGETMYRHGEKMLAESSPEMIESERAANAILTGRIEELETIVKVFRACIETRQFPEQGSRCHKIVHDLVGESE